MCYDLLHSTNVRFSEIPALVDYDRPTYLNGEIRYLFQWGGTFIQPRLFQRAVDNRPDLSAFCLFVTGQTTHCRAVSVPHYHTTSVIGGGGDFRPVSRNS